jgi:hypothetical protein
MVRLIRHILHSFRLRFSYQNLRIALPPIFPWVFNLYPILSFPVEAETLLIYRKKLEIALCDFFLLKT